MSGYGWKYTLIAPVPNGSAVSFPAPGSSDESCDLGTATLAVGSTVIPAGSFTVAAGGGAQQSAQEGQAHAPGGAPVGASPVAGTGPNDNPYGGVTGNAPVAGATAVAGTGPNDSPTADPPKPTPAPKEDKAATDNALANPAAVEEARFAERAGTKAGEHDKPYEGEDKVTGAKPKATTAEAKSDIKAGKTKVDDPALRTTGEELITVTNNSGSDWPAGSELYVGVEGLTASDVIEGAGELQTQVQANAAAIAELDAEVGDLDARVAALEAASPVAEGSKAKTASKSK